MSGKRKHPTCMNQKQENLWEPSENKLVTNYSNGRKRNQ